MKKLPIFFALLFVLSAGYAQQEAQFTQFMYNKLSLNPAYAGSSGVPCISCIHRTQWIGLEGAPSSQIINFHLPMFAKRVGVGASLSHDKIGPTNSFTASMMYAYRMQVGKGTVSFGMKGTLKSFRVKWANLNATHTGDSEIPVSNTNRVFPNFGVGAYFDNEKFYAGISIPNILKTDLSYSHITNNTDFGIEQQHFYVMTGYLFNVTRKVRFKPALLYKYVQNAPMDLDVNATFIFSDKIWTGVSYRMGGDSNSGIGESIDLLVQYQLSPSLKGGISYDFNLSDLRETNSGSVEIQLEYCIKTQDDKLTNPRFF